MKELLNTINTDLVFPIVIILITSIVVIGKSYLNTYTNIIKTNNDMTLIDKEISIRKEFIESLSEIVKSVVGCNMRRANKMKELNQHLSDEQMSVLKNDARNGIMKSLPPSLLKDDNNVLKAIGGKEQLDIIIDNLIDMHVYEYKIKERQIIPAKNINLNQQGSTFDGRIK